jgi:hypothetical protein
MRDDDLVVLQTFSAEASALLAKAILEANGIPSVVSADSASVMEPQLRYARGTRLLVRPMDVAAAAELLEEEPSS